MARNLVMALVICLASSAAYATVTTSTRSIEYTGNATTGPWAATFHFLESDHLVVTKTLTDTGVAVFPFTEGSQYTVTLPVGSVAGYVTTTAAVSAAYTIKIERIVPITQETSFKTQGRFRAASHEDAVDKLTMIAQQLSATTQTGSAIDDAITAHEGLTDPHVGYFLLAGRSGGQHGKGGTGSGENLQLSSTAHATKGKIILGNSGNIVVDDVNTRLGVGTATPTDPLHVSGTSKLVGNVDITGTLDASAATTLATTLDVTGATTLTGTLAANGATTVDDTLHVTGVTTLDTTVYGVDAAGGDLTFESTVDATKGHIYFGDAKTMAYDDTNAVLGLGTTAPQTGGVSLDVQGQAVFRRKMIYYTGNPAASYAVTQDDCGGVLIPYTGAARTLNFVTLPELDGDDDYDGCVVTIMADLLTTITPAATDYILGMCHNTEDGGVDDTPMDTSSPGAGVAISGIDHGSSLWGHVTLLGMDNTNTVSLGWYVLECVGQQW